VLTLTPSLTLSLTLNPNPTNPKLQARSPHFTICLYTHAGRMHTAYPMALTKT